jgi:hypothetical protein
MNPKMELPDDVLQLVRAYAKPWFKHYKEYRRALLHMGLMGPYSCLAFRTCLVYHPERILPLLVELENAHAEFVVAKDAYLRDSTRKSKPLVDLKEYIKIQIIFKLDRIIHV